MTEDGTKMETAEANTRVERTEDGRSGKMTEDVTRWEKDQR